MVALRPAQRVRVDVSIRLIQRTEAVSVEAADVEEIQFRDAVEVKVLQPLQAQTLGEGQSVEAARLPGRVLHVTEAELVDDARREGVVRADFQHPVLVGVLRGGYRPRLGW